MNKSDQMIAADSKIVIVTLCSTKLYMTWHFTMHASILQNGSDQSESGIYFLMTPHRDHLKHNQAFADHQNPRIYHTMHKLLSRLGEACEPHQDKLSLNLELTNHWLPPMTDCTTPILEIEINGRSHNEIWTS